MRLLFFAILLLAAPVLMIAHREYYSKKLQVDLLVAKSLALDAPEFAQVQSSLDYMDVTLRGRVADLATRDRARQLVDALPGLRCREPENLIQVNPKLTGTLTERTLRIAGWLHDEATLRDATKWLADARPGLRVITEDVRVSPHVAIEDAPRVGTVPAAFRSAWAAIEKPARLVILRTDARIKIAGRLPGAGLKEAVVATVRDSSALAIDSTELEAGAYVQRAGFANEPALTAFLKQFFGSPGAMRFEAADGVIRIAAEATPSMEAEWRPLLEPLASAADLQFDVRQFPSIFHFPSRKRQSTAPDETLTALGDVLQASSVNFGPGYATIDSVELPKITAAADAIKSAGPDVRVIVGGHVDLVGNPRDNVTMARRRAEAVIAHLVDCGVASQMLEAAVFETVPGDSAHGRQVELIIK